MPVAGWTAILQPTLFLAMLGGVSSSAGERAVGRHSPIAGMPGGHRSECAGNPQENALVSSYEHWRLARSPL